MRILRDILDFALNSTLWIIFVLVMLACLVVGLWMTASFYTGGIAVVVTGVLMVVAGLIGALFIAASALDNVGN